jgi:peptidoglycan/LPS O-acetylase OafA/YrhL
MVPSDDDGGKTMNVRPYNRDIKVLTSLRMIAASVVVFFHMAFYTTQEALTNFPVIEFGYLGVDFFFVLSGFVLTHVYQPQIDIGRFDYWQFVVKRFARIYPLHFLTLWICVALSIAVGKGWFSEAGAPFVLDYRAMDHSVVYRGAVANLTLIHAWGATPGLLFNQPSWSISAEWFAYLLFPIFVLLRRIPPRGELGKLIVSIVLFFAVMVVVVLVLGVELTKLSWNLGIARIFPEFLIGMSLHRFGETWSAGRLGSLFGFYASLALAIAAIFAADALPHLREVMSATAVVGFGGIVLFGADADRHGGLSLMRARFPVYLGDISYSVYMLHMVVAVVLFEILLPAWRPAELGEALTLIIFALVVVTALSALSHRFYEIPARDWLIRRGRSFNVVEKPVAQ